MTAREPRLLVDLPCDTGEGPLWDDQTQTLLWVDIPNGVLYRFNPTTQSNVVEWSQKESIGGFTLENDGSVLMFGDGGRILHLMDDTVSTLVSAIDGMSGSRFNDVVAAPDGSVYCGTMPWDDGRARLYRFMSDRSLELVCDDLGLSNGMDFSPDNGTMYLSDSDARCVYAFDYSTSNGSVAHRRTLINYAGERFVPDGMTVDAEGDLWVARWDGEGVARHAPTGEQRDFVSFPVQKVSSIAFGGPDYSTAYVTTAGGKDREKDGPLAGSLFNVQLGVSGRAPFRSRITT